MVLFKLQVKVPFSKREDAIELFNFFLGPVSVLPGLIDAGLYIDQDSNELMLLEEWRTKKDMERHICSEEFKNVLAVMEFAEEQPDVQFFISPTIKGIDWLKELRASGFHHN
jgi:quinol monooxygenase YgiN